MSQRPVDLYAKVFYSFPTLKYALGIAIAMVASTVALFLTNEDGFSGPVKWSVLAFVVYALALPGYAAFSKSLIDRNSQVLILASTTLLVVALSLGLFGYAFGWPKELAALLGLKEISGIKLDAEKVNLIALTFGAVSVLLSVVGTAVTYYFAKRSDKEIRRLRFRLGDDGKDFQISVPFEEQTLSEDEVREIISKLRKLEAQNGNAAKG